MTAVETKVQEAHEEKILRDLEGFLLAAYNIYDVAKVIPHPYSAIGEMGNAFLHDFKGFAYSLERYIERNRKERVEQQARDEEHETIMKGGSL